MKSVFLMAAMAVASCSLFAQQKASGDAKQFMLIVRYKRDLPMPDSATRRTNGQHWGEFIGKLAQSGKLVSGLRPEEGGRTVVGKDKTVREQPYDGNKETVSAFFLVKAADLDEATEIARQCPIYELGGSVEIRAVVQAAN